MHRSNHLAMARLIVMAALLPLTAVAADGSTVPVEICRSSTAHTEIDIPEHTRFVHGQPGDAASYTVTLPSSAVLHGYADCLHVDALATSGDSSADDELHLPPDAGAKLPIQAKIARRPAISTVPSRRDSDRAQTSGRTNWPD